MAKGDGNSAPESADAEGLINEHEAARRLGLKVSTLRRWRWSGQGPRHIKLGSAVRYAPSALTDFIAAGVRASTSGAGIGAAGDLGKAGDSRS
jgi:predicted DNA-binding transcriptional regulator AlpA